MGMVRITSLQESELNFMDRIVLLDAESDFNQVIYPKKEGKDTYSNLFYNPIKIKDIFLFNGLDKALKKLTESDYEIQDNFLFFKTNLGDSPKISIKYSHRPQFHVIDLLRDIILQDSTSSESNDDKGAKFPISAIGRRSHYVVDRQSNNLTHLDTVTKSTNLTFPKDNINC